MRLDGERLRLSASDVANFVACGHLTRLDLLHARGEIQPPHVFDVGFEDLVARGEGREAPVAIYSMTTSSADEASRGLEFLYDHRRLNVATSRAKAMAIVVASPRLVQVSCRTPRQMLLVNALCRAWESAGQ